MLALKPFKIFEAKGFTFFFGGKERFSLLTANLTRGVILQLFPHFGRVLDPGGWLILSGILTEQTRDVQDCFSEYGFYEFEALHQAEWACVIARKREEG